MLRHIFRPARRLPDDIRDEIQSICHQRQVETLALSSHVRRDIGIDCGCEPMGAAPRFTPPL